MTNSEHLVKELGVPIETFSLIGAQTSVWIIFHHPDISRHIMQPRGQKCSKDVQGSSKEVFLGFVDGNVISGPNGRSMTGHKSLRFILEKTNIKDMSQHSIEDVVIFRGSNADA